MLATPTRELEHELITRPERVMVVCGIGVSVATCGNHPCASWQGLLKHGLKWCEEKCGTPATTLNAFRTLLNDAPAHALTNVGQFITDVLTRNRPGSFGAWLADSIGGIQATDTKLVRVLASLEAKLSTTNYDNMIEAGTGRSAITWRDKALVTKFVREPTRDVLHLHGYYRQHDSIVLGAHSYGQICNDDLTQTALRSLMFSGTLVFVGCGAGLEDPNFGVLLEWARTILAECHHSHFILVRTGEVGEWRERLRGVPIDPIPYGDEYRDLTPFLETFADRVKQQRIREPLSLLSTSQSDFDLRWEELEKDRENLSALDYFQRSRMFADQLWRAGGRRRAAIAFSSRVTFQGQHLLIPEYVEYSLIAAEWLLDEDLPLQASNHLDEIQQRLRKGDVPAQLLAQFRRLRVRCMNALCAYAESLRAIDEALPFAGDEERAQLEAERSEIHFLQGNFTGAVAEPECGDSSETLC